MRSLREVLFRLRQETGNLVMYARPPRGGGAVSAPLVRLPDPDSVAAVLRESWFAEQVRTLAEQILNHRLPLLGYSIEYGPEIHWRRDPLRQVTSGIQYFRTLPYLDYERAGDHKLIWELNRHQHLVVLAQAFRLSGRWEFVKEIESEIESWLVDNPFLRGINWASALEVAFRAVAWIWIYHLAGESMTNGFRPRFLSSMYCHGRYLARNLSTYFSPNTHLLGEAVALHALGVLFPQFSDAGEWEAVGAQITTEQMARQVRPDGSHFEQSSYYHVYALDMFLFHYLLARPGAWYRERLRAMAEYLCALVDGEGRLPLLGDDDGGRWFHPYGQRGSFARATLATCGLMLDRPEWILDRHSLEEQAVWWLGEGALVKGEAERVEPAGSRLFPDAGVAVMRAGGVQVIVDAGPFGPGNAGHSHSDTLSLVVRNNGVELLTDSGTYTYVADREWRNRFRGSAFHNTVRVDEVDQAPPGGAFSWLSRPEVRILAWEVRTGGAEICAECRYSGFVHRRKVTLESGRLLVYDTVEGPPGQHLCEQFWHFGQPTRDCGNGNVQIGSGAWLRIRGGDGHELAEGGDYGWRSGVFGEKTPAPVLRVWRRAELPVTLECTIEFEG